jgi:hypothetical protein
MSGVRIDMDVVLFGPIENDIRSKSGLEYIVRVKSVGPIPAQLSPGNGHARSGAEKQDQI